MPVIPSITPISRYQRGRRTGSYRDERPEDQASGGVATGVTSESIDFGATLAAGVVEVRTVTIDGVVGSDVVTASPDGNPGTGLVWSSRASAADTVEVRLLNATASSVTLTTRSWSIAVTRLVEV